MDARHDRDDPHATAVPPADGADAAWRRELARLDQLRVVSQAHDIVTDAEHTDLTTAAAAARKRLVDAQQRLIQARADGDAAAVAAAAATVEDAHRAVEGVAARLAAHLQQLADERVRIVQDVVDQAGRVFDAGLAATEAFFAVRRPERRHDG